MLALLIAAAAQPGLVAVLELRNELPAAQKAVVSAGYVTDILRSRIAEAGLPVITRENIIQLLQAQGKRLEDCEAECEVETGRRLGADLVVTGELLQFGSALKVNLRMHQTQSGQLLSGAQASAANVDGLESALGPAIDKLLGPARGRAPRRASGEAPQHKFELDVMAEFAPVGDVNIGDATQNVQPSKSIMAGVLLEAGYTGWNAAESVGFHLGAGAEPMFMPDIPSTFAFRAPAFLGLRFALGGGWVLGADYSPSFAVNGPWSGLEALGAQVSLESGGRPRFRMTGFIHGDVSHGQACSGCEIGGPENLGFAVGAGF